LFLASTGGNSVEPGSFFVLALSVFRVVSPSVSLSLSLGAGDDT
jgi:hypothetical protein